jgi:hypothetical protein
MPSAAVGVIGAARWNEAGHRRSFADVTHYQPME